MRISDWSSDVCSSDLRRGSEDQSAAPARPDLGRRRSGLSGGASRGDPLPARTLQQSARSRGGLTSVRTGEDAGTGANYPRGLLVNKIKAALLVTAISVLPAMAGPALADGLDRKSTRMNSSH